MVEKIKMTQEKVLEFMNQEIGKYGNNRMDVKEIGELADIIKDLSEAEYHCSIVDAMHKGSSDISKYTQPTNDYMMYSSHEGTKGSNDDPVRTIKELLSSANSDDRARIRGELASLMSM